MSFPVRLDEYFFPIQEIKANPKHTPGEVHTVNTQILRGIKKVSDETEDQDAAYSVELRIRTDEKQSSNLPYFLDLSVYGVFFVNTDSLDNTQINALIESTGVSVLFGAARERVASMTSRAPWGTFHLEVMPISLNSIPAGGDEEPATAVQEG